jgi:hypothetical protein
MLRIQTALIATLFAFSLLAAGCNWVSIPGPW